jgi:N-acetylglucosaminyl-diphospho-decaprenol L-rhamnosyltransferase
MPDLSVVIVTWNVRALALEALRSLYADLTTSGLTAEVWVVDSASSDGTPEAVAEAFPQVRLVASNENLGFGRGNNSALRQMGFSNPNVDPQSLPKAVYLLNPDTITQPGATRALYDALFAASDVGLVGAQLSYEDGSFQHGAFGFPGLRQLWVEFFPTPGRFIEGRFNGRYPRGLYDQGKPFPVDFVLGATMMLRREVIQQTGMFDESFFMYCEEIDWAWRIHKAGWQVQTVPVARVTHLAGKSTVQVRPQSVINLWTSRLHLYNKHHPRWKVWAARRLIAAGMARKLRRETDPAVRAAYQRVQELTAP